MSATLPKACPKPCHDCPWRRNAMRGWLGPMTPDEWIALAMSDEPVACHETIKTTDEDGEGNWTDPVIKQCTGAAIFRRNNAKLPRNPEDAANFVKADHEAVFSNRQQFLDYHGEAHEQFVQAVGEPRKKPALPTVPETDRRDEPCDGCRPNEAEWSCPMCSGRFCDGCIDRAGKVCPNCEVDPGWEPLDDMDDWLDDEDDL